MTQDIVERLRFHGRYASESQDQAAIRKNAEREIAANLIEQLRAENERLSKTGLAVLRHYEHGCHNGNAPGHGHAVPGIWDSDNEPAKAGAACQWCADWSAFRAALAAQQKEVG